jgi:hypothetical protein
MAAFGYGGTAGMYGGGGASGYYREPELVYPEQLIGLRFVDVRDNGTWVIVTLESGKEYRVPSDKFRQADLAGMYNYRKNSWQVRYMADWQAQECQQAQAPQTQSPLKTPEKKEVRNSIKRLYFARLHKK